MIFILFQIFICQVHADEPILEIKEVPMKSSHVFFAGHNLTPTTDVLLKNQVTLGSYVVGLGLSDRLMLATSPFFFILYNSAAIDLRYALIQDESFNLTIEGSYLKSLPYQNLGPHDPYLQSTFFTRITTSRKFSDIYSLYLSIGHQYFWNAENPHSLNPTKDRNVLSISTLHKFDLSSNFGIFAEAGVLGLNYKSKTFIKQITYGNEYNTSPGPFTHFGLSFFYHTDTYYIQLGVSRSSGTFEKTPSLSDIEYSLLENIWYHPEIQVQFFL